MFVHCANVNLVSKTYIDGIRGKSFRRAKFSNKWLNGGSSAPGTPISRESQSIIRRFSQRNLIRYYCGTRQRRFISFMLEDPTD